MKCLVCGRPLRPVKADKFNYPGSVVAVVPDLCGVDYTKVRKGQVPDPRPADRRGGRGTSPRSREYLRRGGEPAQPVERPPLEWRKDLTADERSAAALVLEYVEESDLEWDLDELLGSLGVKTPGGGPAGSYVSDSNPISLGN